MIRRKSRGIPQQLVRFVRFVRFASLVLVAVFVGARGYSQSLTPVGLPAVSERLESIFDGQPPRNKSDLEAMQSHIVLLARKINACTVSVQFDASHGSGVLVSEDGYILTVAHIVGQPGQEVVVRLSDGRIARGRSLGMHLELDAGLVKLHDPGPWPYLEMSRAKQVPRGTWCAAAGHPGGHDVRRGPVFRLGRVLGKQEMIRTDCQLVGGDSGGPLVDMHGNVIGIHSRIGVSLVNNLHVPISVYRTHWDDLVNGRQWSSRAFIGLRGAAGTNEAVVAKVHGNSPAEIAGVQVGDVVRRFDGVRVEQFDALVKMVRQRQPGETIRMRIQRGERQIDVDVTIGKRQPVDQRKTNIALQTVATGAVVGDGISADSPSKDAHRTGNGNNTNAVNRVRRWLGRSPRGGLPNQIGKNHELVRSAFDDSIDSANRTTVRVMSGKKQVALGMIVDASGLVVTKASELDDSITCLVPGKGESRARIVATDPELDLALLRLTSIRSGLTAANMTNTPAPIPVGGWVAVPGGFGDRPIVVGVVSAQPRKIDRDMGVLGIVIEDSSEGTIVSRVLPGSGAEAAGVEDGDIILQVDERIVFRQSDVSQEVQRHRPGETIRLRVRREDGEQQLSAVLGRPSQILASNSGGHVNLGGMLSRRRSGFRRIVQHDCLLRANQCGGPLVDVDGNIIGVNIARAGRVASYALPLDIVASAVSQMSRTKEKIGNGGQTRQ